MKKVIKPKFRPDIVGHWFDEKGGGRSMVLEDPVANKFFRISPYEFELLNVLDGTRSLKEAVERVRLHGRHFSVGHATTLVEQFARAGLLLGTQYGSSAYQCDLKKRLTGMAKQRSLVRLYYLFIPIVNPDRFLERTVWLWRLVVNKFTAAVFALLIPGALYLLISGVSRIAHQFSFFFNLHNLLVLWMAIAIMKLVHEFSHAYAAKNLGLRVPEMGIAFLLFFPCLYCNTTAAWQLADRKQRMSIAAAGVMSEFAIAAASIYIWYFTKPGLLNSTAFFLAAVSLISSLLFNGNPLMKFDGYFVLIDWLRMPNLQQRAFARVRSLFFNKVLGMASMREGKAAREDRVILTVYGISAFIYRIFLYSGIVVGVYYRFDKTVGAILGLLAFLLFVVRPVTRGMANLVKKRSELSFRPWGLLVFFLILGSLIFLGTRPWSGNSLYPCYVESALVRQIVIPNEAPVSKVFVREGDTVSEGRIIFRLDPAILNYTLADKEMEAALLKRSTAMIEDTGERLSALPMKYIELSQLTDAVKEIRNDLGKLEWKAPFDGSVIHLAKDLQPGARPGRGTVVGELASLEKSEVLGLIPEEDILSIQRGEEVDVWFPAGGGRSWTLTVKEVSPFNRKDLRDSPFSSRLGGEIATEVKDRRSKDAPLETYYLCKMDLPPGHGMRLGTTGRLVVHHPPKSILDRVVEAAHRTVRRETLF
ncbi:MAG: efflux RND transporter periplasmic adaptor subunit [Pseudomonadota bacterium]